MTVGIGVICEGGDCAILASDVRVTYGKMKVSPHDWSGKQYPFPPFNFAAAIAGSTSSTHAVVSDFAGRLRELLSWKQGHAEFEIQFEHIRNALERARKKELRRLQGCAMESELAVSVNDWIAGKLPTGEKFNQYALDEGLLVLKRVKSEMESLVGIIVAGFLRERPIFLRGIGARPVEEGSTPAIYVVGGKGAGEALQVLSNRKQSIEMGIARSLFHVYEAMNAAQSDRGVGEPADYIVIRPRHLSAPNGVLRYKYNHPTLIAWGKKYKLTGTESLENEFANKLVYEGLFPARAKNSEWLGPKGMAESL